MKEVFYIGSRARETWMFSPLILSRSKESNSIRYLPRGFLPLCHSLFLEPEYLTGFLVVRRKVSHTNTERKKRPLIILKRRKHD